MVISAIVSSVLIFFAVCVTAIGGDAKLDEIVVDSVSCDGVDARAAIKAVFDSFDGSVGYVLFMPSGGGDGKSGLITMTLSNTPLSAVLKAICHNAKLEFKLEDGVVVLSPSPGKGVKVEGLESFDKVIVRRFDLESSDLGVFFKKLSAIVNTGRRGGDKIVLDYVCGAKAKGGRRKARDASGDDGDGDTFFGIDWKNRGAWKLSVSVRGISLSKLISRVCEAARLECSVSKNKLTIKKASKP